MAKLGLSNVKRIISWLILAMSSIALVACSVSLLEGEGCNQGVRDSKFSEYEFEGPYSVKQATQIFNKETGDYPSQDLSNNWVSFLNQVDTSTCIYRFTSSDDDWNKLKGVEGFALTKDAKVINMFIVKKS